MIFACASGSVEIVRLLITVSNVNAVSREGMSALVYAVQQRSMEIVDMLLKAGATVKGHTEVSSCNDKLCHKCSVGWSLCFVSCR